MENMHAPVAPVAVKRKATTALSSRPKKLRTDTGTAKEPVSSDEEQSDDDNYTYNSEDEDDERSHNVSGTSTPLTVPSSKATPNPNWPSMQKTLTCPFEDCGKSFNRQAKLEDHIRSHTNERPFVCTEDGCDKSFTRKTHLNRHLKSAHQNERDFVCSFDECGKAFSTGTRLRRHEAQHVAREQYKCGDCGQEFRKHATLQRHIDTEHKGQKAYVCQHVLDNGSVCGAGFNKSSALKNHQSRTHDEKRYWCDICEEASKGVEGEDSLASDDHSQEFGFATYAEFQAHCKDVHPPTCHICGQACKTNKQMKRHMELEHGVLQNEDKPVYTCPEPGCGKEFGKKGNLDIHVRSVHAKERPFVCGRIELSSLKHIEGWDGHNACGRDFKAKSQLEEHIRTAHLGLQNRMKARKLAKAAAQRPTTKPEVPASVVDRLTGMATLPQMPNGPVYNPFFDNNGFVADETTPTIDIAHELEENARHGGAFWLGDDTLADVGRDSVPRDEPNSFHELLDPALH